MVDTFIILSSEFRGGGRRTLPPTSSPTQSPPTIPPGTDVTLCNQQYNPTQTNNCDMEIKLCNRESSTQEAYYTPSTIQREWHRWKSSVGKWQFDQVSYSIYALEEEIRLETHNLYWMRTPRYCKFRNIMDGSNDNTPINNKVVIFLTHWHLGVYKKTSYQ